MMVDSIGGHEAGAVNGPSGDVIPTTAQFEEAVKSLATQLNYPCPNVPVVVQDMTTIATKLMNAQGGFLNGGQLRFENPVLTSLVLFVDEMPVMDGATTDSGLDLFTTSGNTATKEEAIQNLFSGPQFQFSRDFLRNVLSSLSSNTPISFDVHSIPTNNYYINYNAQTVVSMLDMLVPPGETMTGSLMKNIMSDPLMYRMLGVEVIHAADMLSPPLSANGYALKGMATIFSDNSSPSTITASEYNSIAQFCNILMELNPEGQSS